MFLKIAFRNMLRQKRRTVLTMLTIWGGFTLAAISFGWSDGTYSYIINMFTRNRLGQIEIHKIGYLERPSLYKRISDYTQIGKAVRNVDGVEAWAPRVYSAALASLNDKTAGVQLIGIQPELEQNATRFNKKVIQGRPLSDGSSRQALVGKGLAKILGAKVGNQIVILTQAADGSIANDVYTLIGIVDTGDETTDRLDLYLGLEDAQQLLVLEKDVHEIIVNVDSLNRVDAIAQAIRNKLGNSSLEVHTWKEFAHSFYAAMKADQQGMWIMLFIIILIVAVGVFNTVLMSVLERRREYGLLKAIGVRPGQIVRLVLLELFLIALGGVILGAVLSVGLNWAISIHGIKIPTPMSYGGIQFTHMYSEVNARSLYIPAITVILSAILVGIVPALKAAHTQPAESMRTF